MDVDRQFMLRQTLDDIGEKIRRIPELSSAMEALNSGSDLNTPAMEICRMYRELLKLT